MIPKVNNRGHSFKGVIAYLMHDKGANSSERVLWSETGNLPTNDIEKAGRVMAWTDLNADNIKLDNGGALSGRKTEAGAVYHYSLAWEHGAKPSKEHMRAEALKTLERLGLESHQYFIVAHDDTKHAHIHIVANLTNQETGKRHTPSFDKRELSSYALEYEQEHGLQCKNRLENSLKREQGEHIKYQDTRQEYARKVAFSYHSSDNGLSFCSALNSEGLILAQGRRGGLVLVDEQGDIQKLARQVEGVKAKEIKSKLSDLNLRDLPDAQELSNSILNQETESGENDGREEKTQKANNSKEEKEATSEEVHAQKSTADIANEYVQLARNPLQDMRRWMDETGSEIRHNSLFTGQAGSTTADNELRQVRGEGASGNAQGGTQGNENTKQADSGQGYKRNEQESKYLEYDKYISKKVADSRKTWDIDELTQKRDSAAQNLSDNGSIWAMITLKKRDARQGLQSAQLTLDDRLNRWKADIEAYNQKRPEWVQKRELKKYGFISDVGKQQTDQDKGRTDQQKARADSDSKLLEEAASSPENASRLQYFVKAKTNSQKAQISQVMAKAEKHKRQKADGNNVQEGDLIAKQEAQKKEEDKKKLISDFAVNSNPEPPAKEQRRGGWFPNKEEQEQTQEPEKNLVNWFNDKDGQEPDDGYDI